MHSLMFKLADARQKINEYMKYAPSSAHFHVIFRMSWVLTLIYRCGHILHSFSMTTETFPFLLFIVVPISETGK